MDFLCQVFPEAWKLWLIAGIAFMISEGITAGTFSLFFGGVGALTTALICYFSSTVAANGTQQLLFFSSMSLLSLFLLRSRFLRLIHNDIRLNGPEAFIGRQARARTNLRRNGLETGKVLFEGTEWSAVPSDDFYDIPAGSTVEVVKMDGLTLHVRLVQTKNIQK